MILRWLKKAILSCFIIQPHEYGDGLGRFDSVDGTYDDQTGFGFDDQLYHEARTRTFIGSLSKANKKTTEMDAFGGPGIDNTTFIWRKEITAGDEVRLTLQEAAGGMPVYGDLATERGDFLAYKNQKARVNQIKSMAIPVVGEMSQQRVRHSLTDLPGAVREAVLDWMAEQMEIEAIIAYLYGASPSCLQTTANGGLGVSLGPGSGIGAGTPLFGMHWYTTDSGFITYDGSALATHNGLVNTAVQGIDAAAADQWTQAQHEMIRDKLDDLKFKPGTINGKTFKAICLADPQIVWRIRHLLHDDYRDALQRSKDNPIFNVNYQIELDDILYLPIRNLKKFRPDYSASPLYPDIGPGMTEDPRTYTTSSTNGLCIYIGSGSLLEGYNGKVRLTKFEAPHEDGLEIGARTKLGYIRGQWDTKDGRTESSCYSCLAAAFYEGGVGTNWT